jgi:hypothetical protein
MPLRSLLVLKAADTMLTSMKGPILADIFKALDTDYWHSSVSELC